MYRKSTNLHFKMERHILFLLIIKSVTRGFPFSMKMKVCFPQASSTKCYRGSFFSRKVFRKWKCFSFEKSVSNKLLTKRFWNETGSFLACRADLIKTICDMFAKLASVRWWFRDRVRPSIPALLRRQKCRQLATLRNSF